MPSCGFREASGASQLHCVPLSQKILLLPGGSAVPSPCGLTVRLKQQLLRGRPPPHAKTSGLDITRECTMLLRST